MRLTGSIHRALGGLEVQARTDLAIPGNYDATVFVAFAAKVSSSFHYFTEQHCKISFQHN